MIVIFTKYLIKETIKSQLAILFILMLVFFCQKMVKIIEVVSGCDIPTSLIFSLLGLGMSEMAQLILPLTLFLGLFITLSRLHSESEIVVMHACGLGKIVLIRVALVLSIITAFFAALNVIWISPWSYRHQAKILLEVKANPSITSLLSGQFQSSRHGNYVLFLGIVKEKKCKNIFFAQLKLNNKSPSYILIANKAHIFRREDGSQIITLYKGTKYEGSALPQRFRITQFSKYQAIINHQLVSINNNDAEQFSIKTLWKTSSPEACAELHWRLTVVVSIVIMAIMVVPLSAVNPRQGRMLSIIPAMMLYLIFFLLQTSLRSNGSKGKLDPMSWMWFSNGVYLLIAILLNMWDSVLGRWLRHKLHRKEAT